MIQLDSINYIVMKELIWVFYHHSGIATWLCSWLCLHSLVDGLVALTAVHSLIPHNRLLTKICEKKILPMFCKWTDCRHGGMYHIWLRCKWRILNHLQAKQNSGSYCAMVARVNKWIHYRSCSQLCSLLMVESTLLMALPLPVHA